MGGPRLLSRARVAFIASSDSTFIRRDLDMLSSMFRVRRVRWDGLHKIPSMASKILRSDVAFSWFALDHAYVACRLAHLIGRKSAVVVGGIDAAKVPDLGYGVHLDKRKSRYSAYALAHSDRVLLVDESLRAEIAKNTGLERKEFVTVPLGFDAERFRPGTGLRSTVLTVGFVSSTNLRRKGMDTFARAAANLPDLQFVIVGAGEDRATQSLRSITAPNITILPITDEAGLLREYQRARVYAQLSLYEGLPSALGEAMACGCVPVGTRVAGIPSLIGDTGYFVPPGDAEAAETAIRQAFEAGDGGRARERIAREFSVEKRREALRRTIEELAYG